LGDVSIFPITPLVRRVQRLIVETFEVSEQAAEDHAAQLVSLAEGWGSPESAAQWDWSYRIKKDLGGKLAWRSKMERETFEATEKQKHQAYDAFIRRRPGQG
jgi:hypothetical protein